METGKIFVSYRNATSKWQAISVYYALRSVFGRNVFIDKIGLKSGDWWPALKSTIEAHRHFIVILSKDSLSFNSDKGKWFRGEIQHAIKHSRNIVPVVFEDFDFESQEVKNMLARYKLTLLRKKQSVSITYNNFEGDLIKLNSFLNGSSEIPERPLTKKDKEIIETALESEYPSIREDNAQFVEIIGETSKANNSQLQKDSVVIQHGQSPYVASISSSLGIPVARKHEPKLSLEIIRDNVGELWYGIAITNDEKTDITGAFVKLTAIRRLDKDTYIGLKRPAPAAYFGWSSVYNLTDRFTRIPRSGTKKIDILRSSLKHQKMILTGVNGKSLLELDRGRYLLYIKIYGSKPDNKHLVKNIALVADFKGAKNITLDFYKSSTR